MIPLPTTLVQYFGELGVDIRVFRNDEISVDDIATLEPEHIVISPGPCTPKEAGVSVETIKTFSGKIPILGVCLGHQEYRRGLWRQNYSSQAGNAWKDFCHSS